MTGRITIPCEDVVRIREDWDTGFYSTRELGRLYGTSQQNILSIVKGQTRKDCGGPIDQTPPEAPKSLGQFLSGD